MATVAWRNPSMTEMKITYYTWNPIDLCLIGKGHISGGWWSKIEVIQVLGIYIYIYKYHYICGQDFQAHCTKKSMVGCALTAAKTYTKLAHVGFWDLHMWVLGHRWSFTEQLLPTTSTAYNSLEDRDSSGCIPDTWEVGDVTQRLWFFISQLLPSQLPTAPNTAPNSL